MSILCKMMFKKNYIIAPLQSSFDHVYVQLAKSSNVQMFRLYRNMISNINN